MFCNRCEGEYFILIYDNQIGPVKSEGILKTWELWQCMECGLYKRIVKEIVIRGSQDTNEKYNGAF